MKITEENFERIWRKYFTLRYNKNNVLIDAYRKITNYDIYLVSDHRKLIIHLQKTFDSFTEFELATLGVDKEEAPV